MINRPAYNRYGFTLVEAIIVIAITGVIAAVVAIFIRTPVQAYFDSAARAELVDVADTALRRMARDLRLALPNSIRINGQYLELLLTRDGGRYLAEEDNPTGANPPILDFNDTTRLTFNIVGPVPAISAGDQLVVYNLGPNQEPANAYNCIGQCNRAQVASDPVGSTVTLTANPFAAQSPSMRSPSQRFQVVTTPVTYACVNNTLIRYSGYAIQKDQPADITTSPLKDAPSQAPLAKGQILTCTFSNASMTNTRSGLVGLGISITGTGSAGTVQLFHQVHVDNTP